MSFLFAVACYVIVALVLVWQVGLRIMPGEDLPRKPWIGFCVNACITSFVLWKLLGGLLALILGLPFLEGVLSPRLGPIFGSFCFGMLPVLGAYLAWVYYRRATYTSEERILLAGPKSLVMTFAGCFIFLVLMWLSPISYFQDAQSYGTAPDFELVDMEGQTHRMSDYEDSGVVLSFWATWCPPCRAELPILIKAAEQYPDLPIVGVSMDAPEDLRELYEQYTIRYPTLLDSKNKMHGDYGVDSFPTTILVGKDGAILARHTGLVSPALLATWRRWLAK